MGHERSELEEALHAAKAHCEALQEKVSRMEGEILLLRTHLQQQREGVHPCAGLCAVTRLAYLTMGTSNREKVKGITRIWGKQ